MSDVSCYCCSHFLVLLIPGAAARDRQAAAESGASRNFRDCPNCPEMVTIPAGEFLMGSPESERGRGKDEGPQHKVTFAKPFAAGKYEVTFAEWDACVADGGCTENPGDESWGRGRHPVINVSWHDAQQFTAWLSKKTGKPYRLLTEAEWEYSARGETKATDPSTPYATGHHDQCSGRPITTPISPIMAASRRFTGKRRWTSDRCRATPSASTRCTAMSGNGFRIATSRPMKAPPRMARAVITDDCRLHILRGGAWNYYPKLLRSAYRYATAPEVRLNNAGFRVARDLVSAAARH